MPNIINNNKEVLIDTEELEKAFTVVAKLLTLKDTEELHNKLVVSVKRRMNDNIYSTTVELNNMLDSAYKPESQL
jgi:hypothetical protein|tara:strand:+ start:2040 stop:2264 length:225 start_codon:yes stop_codon:yes gene_type:complete